MSLNAIDDTRYGPVTRAEYAALLERIAELERKIAELKSAKNAKSYLHVGPPMQMKSTGVNTECNVGSQPTTGE